MASSSWVATAATIPADRKRVIGELTRGREIADQLRAILRETGDHDDTSTDSSVLPAQVLVGKILDSYTQSLLLLSAASGESDEVSQVPAVVNSPGRKSEDSGDSCKTPAPKDRRGCYKRRKTSETWTKETPTLFDDGLAWRKYGQKVILNAIHPRCTHKYDQRCVATKHVQKVKDDPPLFRTTYHGHHTCTNLLKSTHHHIIMDDDTTQDSNSTIWNFQSRQQQPPDINYNKKANTPAGLVININPATTIAVIKQENNLMEEQQHDHIIRSSSSSISAHESAGAGDYYISAHDHDQLPSTFDHVAAAFSSGSDHGDAISSDLYSCTASTHSRTMDMEHLMVDSVNFDDFLQF
ncbi:hypothetical protein BUALT_Bualt09G0137100 [Buddleja alternifolia]|uniref:WRKY domain-containing protein n=1 Tax=Buddleja alternifolia TaxID=168488 RepID=A0AAV6X9S5_9LAMI|nr:hypothetical protein BUALT_Bualt09G0137100 [Buddleja alternifolia]